MQFHRTAHFLLPPILLLACIVLLAALSSPSTTRAAHESNQGIELNGTLRAFNFLTSQWGWSMIDQSLYNTADGGDTWIEITPPDSGIIWSVYFQDPQLGWAVITPSTATGATPGFQFSTTVDGGMSWQASALELEPFPDLPGEPPAEVHLTFVDPDNGWIVFKRPTSSNFSQGTLFRTQDGGASWQRLEIPLGEPVSFLDPDHGFVKRPALEEGNYTGPANFETFDGGQTWLPSQPPALSESVIELELTGSAGMVTDLDVVAGNAWFGIERIGACPTGMSKTAPESTLSAACSQTQRLVRSRDGGQTWQPLALPVVFSPPMLTAPDLTATGHAFDKCEAASLAQLQAWWNYSPYRAVNLYIGGVSRSCTNTAINPSYLSQADRQGWSLIPTWVGPQAACTNYTYKMSSDSAAAYQEGYNEANLAAATAQNLRLWGQVIYYDLEAFDVNNPGCLNAAKAFMNGWTFRLHEWGFVSGVYGSPCNSGLKDFWGLDNRPLAVWIAHWIYPGYNAGATVWTSVCSFSNSYWPNHQRLRQYAGGHSETWGSVSLSIDSNVMDGTVARAFGQPPQACPAPSTPAAAGAILYTGINYDCYTRQAGYGYIWRSTSGLQNFSAQSAFFDNRASSIYLPPGWSVRLYEDLNPGGGKACLNASTASFAGLLYDNGNSLDNSVSRFEVFTGSNCLPRAVFPATDSTPPQAAITSHTTGGYISGSVVPVTITASIQDSGSGVSHAQFFAGADSGSGWAWQSLGWDTDGGDGWSAQWTPGALSDLTDIGLYVYAWDQAGNPAGGSALHLSYDSQPPVSTVQPLPGNLSTTAIRVAWQATDNLSGVDHVDLQVRVDNGSWQDWLTGVSAAQAGGTYYGQFGHSYGFRARAADKAGNQEAYPTSADATTAISACTGDAFEPDDSRAVSVPLAVGGSQNHNFCGLGDVDWLAIQVAAGKVYVFNTSNLGATTDTVISLWDAQGNKLAENDNAPGASDGSSRLLWAAPVNATVYLKVMHVDSRVAGNAVTYQVSARLPQVYYMPVIYK